MKKFELTFTFLQLPVDYAMLILAGFAAYALRFTEFMQSIRPVVFDLPWQRYWPLLLAVAGGWILIYAFSGLYTADPNRKLADSLRRLVMASSTGFAAIAIYVFFSLQKFDSRFLVLAGYVLAIVFTGAGRIIIYGLKYFLRKRGIGLRNTVIIGKEAVAEKIKNTFFVQKGLGYNVVGFYEHFDEETAKIILEKLPDEMIFTDPKANEESALRAIEFANEHNIAFKYSADLFATLSTNMTVSAIAGIPIVEMRRTRLYGWGRIIKRIFDICGSFILLILFSPAFLAVAIIIFVETGLPVIYKNERVGQNGKKFFVYKFRSMRQKYCTGSQFGTAGEEALKIEEDLIKVKNSRVGPIYKIKDDPRVTRFGKFIRRSSLDELPQFWNVFKGEMSLVGPRPHQPREVEKYPKQNKIVLAIKPGVTGMAQISGRSDLNFEEEMKLDTFYIEHWSLFADLIILIKTPFIVLKGKGVK